MDFIGVRVSDGMVHWRPVLEKWCDIVVDWCNKASPDRPWWHNEVSNAALISIAATDQGHVTLVESEVPKYNPASNRSGSGRSDLWVKFVDVEPAGEEFIELKLDVLRGDSIERLRFDSAVLDAQAVNYACRAKVAACIYIVKKPDMLDQRVCDEIAERVGRSVTAEAASWVFPASVRHTLEVGGVAAPGMILVMRRVGAQSGSDYSTHSGCQVDSSCWD